MFFSRKMVVGFGGTALLLGGAYFMYSQANAGTEAVVPMQEVEVAKGTLRLMVTGAGTIKPLRTADLSFSSSGVVEAVHVQTGDTVTEGMPLAKLDPEPLEFSLRQAELNLRTAELNLEELRAGARPEEITASQAGLAAARERLNTMLAQGNAADIRSAKANLQKAQASLEQLTAPTQGDILAAEASVITARGNLQNAIIRLDKLRNPSHADVAAAEASVQSNHLSLEAAKEALEKLLNPTEEAVSAARAAVKNAEISLSNAEARLITLRQGISDPQVFDLIEAYRELLVARERLARDRSLNAVDDQLRLDEEAVLLALLKVQRLEKEADAPAAGVTARDMEAASTSVEAAGESLVNARVRLETLFNPSAVDKAAKQRAIMQAESSLVSSQAKLDQLLQPTALDIASLETSVISAEASLKSAQAKLDLLLHPTVSAIASAEAAVAQAEKQLEDTRTPYKDADFASQRANVQQAEAQLEKLMAPSTAQDIAKSQLAVDKATLDMELAQQNLDKATLFAPFSGIMSAVSISQGTRQGVGNSTVVMSIIDPSEMQVEVSVDETDVAKLSTDATALVTIESVSPVPFQGKVLTIAPKATIESGVATYAVLLSIQGPAIGGQRDGARAARPQRAVPGGSGEGRGSGARPGREPGASGDGQGTTSRQRPQRVQGGAAVAERIQENLMSKLRQGMTAIVEIIYLEQSDVLVVPNRALKTAGGERTVQALVNGLAETRVVTVGLSDDTNTEINEGLQEGDIVLIESSRSSATSTSQGRSSFRSGGIGR